MDFESAILTAIDYEKKIRDIYRQAVETVADPQGRHILQSLADDEGGHVKYLENRLVQWRRDGSLCVEGMLPAMISRDRLADETRRIEKDMAGEDRGDEKRILSRALKAEIDTSDFYRRMSAEMDGPAREMFARFLEIEEGHIDVVQAQLDYLSGSGFWLGLKEFDMEE